MLLLLLSCSCWLLQGQKKLGFKFIHTIRDSILIALAMCLMNLPVVLAADAQQIAANGWKCRAQFFLAE